METATDRNQNQQADSLNQYKTILKIIKNIVQLTEYSHYTSDY